MSGIPVSELVETLLTIGATSYAKKRSDQEAQDVLKAEATAAAAKIAGETKKSIAVEREKGKQSRQTASFQKALDNAIQMKHRNPTTGEETITMEGQMPPAGFSQFMGVRSGTNSPFKKQQEPLLRMGTNVFPQSQMPRTGTTALNIELGLTPPPVMVGTFDGNEMKMFNAEQMDRLNPVIGSAANIYINKQPFNDPGDAQAFATSERNAGKAVNIFSQEYKIRADGSKELGSIKTGPDALKFDPLPEQQHVQFMLDGVNYILPTQDAITKAKNLGYDTFKELPNGHSVGIKIAGSYTMQEQHFPDKLSLTEKFSSKLGGTHPTKELLEQAHEDKGLLPITVTGYDHTIIKSQNGQVTDLNTTSISGKERDVTYGYNEKGELVTAETPESFAQQYPDVEISGTLKKSGNDILSATPADTSEDDALIITQDGVTKLASEADSNEEIASSTTITTGKRKLNVDGDVIFIPENDKKPESKPNYAFDFKLGDMQMGVVLGSNPAKDLLNLQTKIGPDQLAALNGNDVLRKQYLDIAVPTIFSLTKLAQGKDPATGMSYVDPDQVYTNAADMIRNNFAELLKIKGMEEAIMAQDSVSLKNKEAEIQDLVQGSTNLQSGEIVYTVTMPFKDPTVIDANKTMIAPFTVGPQNTNLVNETILPVLSAIHGSPEVAKKQLATNIINETVRETIMTNGGPIVVNRADPLQASLTVIDRLNRTVTVDGSTMYGKLFEISNRGYKYVSDSQYRTLSDEVLSLPMHNGIRLIRSTIGPRSTQNGQAYAPPAVIDAAKDSGLLGFETTETKKARAEAKGQIIPSARGIKIGKTVINSFESEDGGIGPSTLVVDAAFKTEGVFYLFRKGFGEIFDLVGKGKYSDLSNTLKGRTDDALQQIASESGLTVKTTDSGKKMLHDEIQAMADDAKEFGGNDAQRRKLAARQFHIIALAYEISAAIQGGTGGRTISDQDVALILRALRQGGLNTPDAQKAVAEAAVDLLRDINAHATYASSRDPEEIAAYSLWTSMSVKSDKLPPNYRDINSVASTIRAFTAPGADEETDDDTLSMDEQKNMIAKIANENNMRSGNSTLSFDETSKLDLLNAIEFLEEGGTIIAPSIKDSIENMGN